MALVASHAESSLWDMIFLDLAFGSHLCVVGGKEGRAVG